MQPHTQAAFEFQWGIFISHRPEVQLHEIFIRASEVLAELGHRIFIRSVLRHVPNFIRTYLRVLREFTGFLFFERR